VSRVEERLIAAAEETRRVAATRRVPPLKEERARSSQKGWLAFAAAFAVVVVFGLLPGLIGGGDGDPAASTVPGPPVSTATPPTTTPATTTATEPSSCPEGPTPRPVEGLPQAVAETRDGIIAAAISCDFETLERLAGDRFTTSFGGGGAENLSVWNDRGLEPTVTLLHLLDMTYTMVEGGDGPIYVWPTAYGYTSWDQITQEDLDELSRIHTEAELDSFAAADAYLGWRTGIDENGNWLFFVAGD
jgi:hypothetical protein